jgi:hypothetical protein
MGKAMDRGPNVGEPPQANTRLKFRLRRPRGLALWIILYSTAALVIMIYQRKWEFAVASAVTILLAAGFYQFVNSE